MKKTIIFFFIIVFCSITVSATFGDFGLYLFEMWGESTIDTTDATAGESMDDHGWAGESADYEYISNINCTIGNICVKNDGDGGNAVWNNPDITWAVTYDFYMLRNAGEIILYIWDDGPANYRMKVQNTNGSWFFFWNQASGANSQKLTDDETGNWVHFQIEYNPSSYYGLYVDGSLVANLTSNVDASHDIIYTHSDNANNYFDEFEAWNGTLDDDPSPAGDIIPPNVSFNNQTPDDINTFNLIGNNFTLTYNMSDDIELNVSTVFLYYKTNTSTKDFSIYVNGTALTGFQQKDDEKNISKVFTFNMNEGEVYPATYNLDHDVYEDNLHSSTTLSNSNSGVKVELLNVSGNTNVSIIEFMANSTGIGALDIFYCNSSYTTGNYESSTNCVEFGSILATDNYNHTHSQYSFHHFVNFPVNNSFVQNVRVTSKSFFILSPAISENWYIWYVPNQSRTTSSESSVNVGVTWNTVSGTYDLHVHQYNSSGTNLNYYACGNDTSNNENCTPIVQESILAGELPPSSPVIITPIADIYADNILINWTDSFSPTSAINFYNISLLNITDGLSLLTISSSVSDSNFTFDSNGIDDGNYTIKVTACTVAGLCSSDISDEIEIDNTNPTITIYEPPNLKTYTNDSINFNYLCSDSNLFGFDTWIYNSSQTLYNDTGRNLEDTVYHHNITFNLSAYGDGDYTFKVACQDGHTKNIIDNLPVSIGSNVISIGDFSINTYSTSIFDYEKLSDRYSFNIIYLAEDLHRITVSSDDYIYIVKNTKYPCHLVTNNYWFDCSPYKPSGFKRLNDNEIEFYVYGRDLLFNSVGVLNNYTESRSFTIDRIETIIVNWDNLNPSNNTLFNNQTTLSFQFNYTHSNVSVESQCTLWRDSLNVSSGEYLTALNNMSDETISNDFNGNHSYYIECWTLNNGAFRNTTVKLIRFNNSPYTPTPLTLAEVLQYTNRILLVIFFFVIHFIFLYLGIRFNVSAFTLIGGALGVVIPLVSISLLDGLLSAIPIILFVIYCIASTTFLIYSALQNET